MSRIFVIFLSVFVIDFYTTMDAQITRYAPIKKNLTIKRIKRQFIDLYFIYATCDDTLYKIVSYIDKTIPKGKKLKKGRTYALWIQSIFDNEIFNGIRQMPPEGDPWGCFYANHPVDKETKKGIWNIYDSRQLSGKRLIDDSLILSCRSTDKYMITVPHKEGYTKFMTKTPQLRITYGKGLDASYSHYWLTDLTLNLLITDYTSFGFGTGYGQYNNFFRKKGSIGSTGDKTSDSDKRAHILPLFFKAKRNIMPHSRLHPYMQLEAGMNFYLPTSATNKTVEGIYLSPQVGINYKCFRHKFFYEMGYKYEKFLNREINMSSWNSHIMFTIGYAMNL